MSAFVIAPHADDCELFSCFNALRHKAHVVVCLRSDRMNDPAYPHPEFHVDHATRRKETRNAMRVLGLSWEQWGFTDIDPTWSEVGVAMERLTAARPSAVFAPAIEDGGHDQHNEIGRLAFEIFGRKVTHYLTYTRTDGRSRGTEVAPEPEWIALKHRALACHLSQIRHPATRPWFLGDLREYVA